MTIVKELSRRSSSIRKNREIEPGLELPGGLAYRSTQTSFPLVIGNLHVAQHFWPLVSSHNVGGKPRPGYRVRD